MKLINTIAIGSILALTLATPLHAQSAAVNGEVTKVDQGAGKITIKHGPLKQFGMDDPMTMVFRAAEPDALKSVKVGDKITFVPERVNGQFTATRIEKAK